MDEYINNHIRREAWETLHFDVLFHGSDWQNSDMYRKIVLDFERRGVDVVFFPYTTGVSSTELTNLIKNIL